MKLKSNRTSKINYGFAISLLIVLGLLGLALHFSSQQSETSRYSDLIQEENSSSESRFDRALLELQINRENFKKIKAKRAAALDKGLLFTSRQDLVPADVRIGDKTFPVNVRLKGDLLDHLRGDKWSYRIELKNNETWRSMSEFSIHNSKARSQVAEWLMHKLFAKEGIITPAYDFVNVKENGIHKGVYAYEEHFTDALLLRNGKQIAPILKHNDDGYWENVQRDVSPFYWTKTLEIDLFNSNNEGDQYFMNSFEYGKSMLYKFLESEVTAGEVFDLNKMARYYALMELSHAFHAQQITNIRFYLNPLTGKLEPIAFDCFGEDLPAVTKDWAAAGEGINSKVKPRKEYPYGGVYMHLLFQDTDFYRKYIHYLEKFTQAAYLNQIKKEFSPGLEKRELFIQNDAEYQDYRFSFEDMFKKAEFTRKKIQPLPSYSLKIFTNHQSRRELSIQSFHYFPMEILGFGNEDELLDSLASPFVLEAYNKDVEQEVYKISNSKERKYLYYKTIGTDKVLAVEINAISAPSKEVKGIDRDLSYWFDNQILNRVGDELFFTNQKTILDKHLVIPAEYQLTVLAGQQIQLKNESAILSYGRVVAEGALENRIKFSGDGEINQSILVAAQSGVASLFSYCDFSDLTSIQHKGINSLAGINISGGVRMSHCILKNIRAENALSISAGSVDVSHINVSQCNGNGIRLFNVEGQLIHSRFEDVGENGIDLFLTQIEMHNNSFNNIDNTAIVIRDSDQSQFSEMLIKNAFHGILIDESIDIRFEGIDFENMQSAIHLQGTEDNPTSAAFRSMSSIKVEDIIKQDKFSILTINEKKVGR